VAKLNLEKDKSPKKPVEKNGSRRMTAGPGLIPNMAALSPAAQKSASIKASLKLMNKDQMMGLIKQSLSSG